MIVTIAYHPQEREYSYSYKHADGYLITTTGFNTHVLAKDHVAKKLKSETIIFKYK